MALWTVHSKSGQSEEDTRFVRDGFSWWGFLFPLPWLAVKGMWVVLLAAAGAQLMIWALASVLDLGSLASFIASFGINLIVGFEGNDLHRWTLARGGFREIGLAGGSDLDEAELRFFIENPPATPATSEELGSAYPPSSRWKAEEPDFIFPGFSRS